MLISVFCKAVAVTKRRVFWWLLGIVSAIFCISWTPFPNCLLGHLENAYSPPTNGFNTFAGVVVLGGSGLPIYAAFSKEEVELFRVTERMVAAAQLARKHSNLLVLYTNGRSPPKYGQPGSDKQAGQSARFFRASGISEVRMIFERAATDTRENAIFSARQSGVDITKPWLLMTSAAHMPRAMAIFEATGWNVTAYPVDYKTSQGLSLWSFSLSEGATLWQNLAYELMAWAKYIAFRWV